MKIFLATLIVIILLSTIWLCIKQMAINFYEEMREDLDIKRDKETIKEVNRRLDLLKSNKNFWQDVRFKYWRNRRDSK